MSGHIQVINQITDLCCPENTGGKKAVLKAFWTRLHG